MNAINELCLQKYKPEVDHVECLASNYPYNEDIQYTEEKMSEFNPGELPPHSLKLKIGCYLMLLRNWSLHDGLANGTRLRLLDIRENRKAIKVEVLTGPRVKKAIVTNMTTRAPLILYV